jgi:MOSC domain-containing protein YiiM
MEERIIGKVLKIALRTRPKGPMQEVLEATGSENGGLTGDVDSRPDRGITFLASQQWVEVTRELEKEIPWHTRRANVLVDAPSLANLIGRTITVGDVRVRINAETLPCSLMDRLEPGLKAALTPDCRAGVYGRILDNGRLRVGDVVVLQA